MEQTQAAKEFFEKYITTTDIKDMLKVERMTIMQARNSGRLPGAIDVHGQFFVWERKAIMPYLDAWKKSLEYRRSNRKSTPGNRKSEKAETGSGVTTHTIER